MDLFTSRLPGPAYSSVTPRPLDSSWFYNMSSLVVLLARGVLGLFLQLGHVVLGGTAVLVPVGLDLMPEKEVLVFMLSSAGLGTCACADVVLGDGACACAR
jgi:hypothetical protein